MKLRLSPLVLSVAVALEAVGDDSSAERRPTTQNAVLHAVSPPQAAENIDASKGRVSNKDEDSNGGVTTKYPEILFNSTQISTTKTGGEQYQAKITGQLTLHGVTRPITIPAQVTRSRAALRARGEFPIRHSDYNIKRLSAGGGTVKAKDEMKLSFDVVANKYQSRLESSGNKNEREEGSYENFAADL